MKLLRQNIWIVFEQLPYTTENEVIEAFTDREDAVIKLTNQGWIQHTDTHIFEHPKSRMWRWLMCVPFNQTIERITK
jgi:hypothetical protein